MAKIEITDEVIDTAIKLPAKKWYSLAPKTREVVVTALMVGAAVYIANKLSSSSTPATINVDTVTVTP